MAKKSRKGIIILLVILVLVIILYVIFMMKVKEVYYMGTNGYPVTKKVTYFQMWTGREYPDGVEILYKQ